MMQIFRKLGWTTQRSRKEAELREELEFHLEEEADEAKSAGLTKEGAKFAARLGLGNVALVMEDTRATWGWICLERFWQDLRYAVRTLRRNPGFAATAILSLALGIGTNTAIFSLLNAVVLKPLPVPNPRELVQLTNSIPLWETGSNWQKSLFAYPQLETYRAHAKTMSGRRDRVGAHQRGVPGNVRSCRRRRLQRQFLLGAPNHAVIGRWERAAAGWCGN